LASSKAHTSTETHTPEKHRPRNHRKATSHGGGDPELNGGTLLPVLFRSRVHGDDGVRRGRTAADCAEPTCFHRRRVGDRAVGIGAVDVVAVQGVVPQPNGRWAPRSTSATPASGSAPSRTKTLRRALRRGCARYRGREAATNFLCAAAEAELAFLAAHSRPRSSTCSESTPTPTSSAVGLRRGRGMGARAADAVVGAGAPFEKAVTPSDVGKLHRLVVPKQHAEKHFPLKRTPETTTTTGKGVLLNFEDGEGKGLGAGDSIVFSCSAYGQEKQFFIDCKKNKTMTSCPADDRGAATASPPVSEPTKGEQVRVRGCSASTSPERRGGERRRWSRSCSRGNAWHTASTLQP
ncbi:hypothetical protein ZWY2020_031028, partial [Hordeum vulgare]